MDFFELSSPAYYEKLLVNTENSDRNKTFVAEMKDRIPALKERIKK